ncbi:MAG: glutamate 5-kinase [Myxococcota bacterium]|nr:glutamate 5-kinase [Myxococcota bacterium]
MSQDSARKILKRAQRIVVKVGSSTLTRDGVVRPRKFTDLSNQIATLVEKGRQVVLVSSGAIAVGSHRLSWTKPGRSIPAMQAAAAVGQIGLIELYQRRFARRGLQVAQVLLTRAGLEDRERFLNARHTLNELLQLGVVPIVNENDTVATDEIRFGDNDNLSAQIVNLVSADLLVILTDVDGLHHEKPVYGRPKPPLFGVIEGVTAEIESAALGSSNAFGRGGMITKVEAARAAARCGAATVLCNGAAKDILTRLAAGELNGTMVLPGERLASKKHWLAYTSRTRGELVVDEGAAAALLKRGRSLLPAGIVEVRGRFRVGDSISCVTEAGSEFARGLTAYASDEVDRIKGLTTGKIATELGYSNGSAVIHRDDLVVLEQQDRG